MKMTGVTNIKLKNYRQLVLFIKMKTVELMSQHSGVFQPKNMLYKFITIDNVYGGDNKGSYKFELFSLENKENTRKNSKNATIKMLNSKMYRKDEKAV
ncbi:hypothetical protein [Bartonella krasnovii]|uniref:hypothetical protein n=1 Tax=Bartonella krasnovii TaxID=2267275 RepID=UPI001F4C86B1|nr:hypothetical protein [Bartonella krasnovii]UNF46593.1 hypothetical protein MNL05_05785 [Bartonella krasnovii]